MRWQEAYTNNEGRKIDKTEYPFMILTLNKGERKTALIKQQLDIIKTHKTSTQLTPHSTVKS